MVADLREAAQHFLGHDLDISDAALETAADSAKFLDCLASAGSASPNETRALIARWHDHLASDEESVAALERTQEECDRELISRATAIAQSA